jgi:hypothetical protein
MFAKLAGIQVELSPSEASRRESGTAHLVNYDASMMSTCFLPVLRRVMDLKQLVKTYTNQPQMYCVANSFMVSESCVGGSESASEVLVIRLSL